MEVAEQVSKSKFLTSKLIQTDMLMVTMQCCREAEEYSSTGEQRELEAKRVSEKVIQRQFAMRKGSTPHVIKRDGKNEDVEEDFSSAKVKAAACTASKVNGLTVAVSKFNFEITYISFHVSYSKVSI